MKNFTFAALAVLLLTAGTASAAPTIDICQTGQETNPLGYDCSVLGDDFGDIGIGLINVMVDWDNLDANTRCIQMDFRVPKDDTEPSIGWGTCDFADDCDGVVGGFSNDHRFMYMQVTDPVGVSEQADGELLVGWNTDASTIDPTEHVGTVTLLRTEFFSNESCTGTPTTAILTDYEVDYNFHDADLDGVIQPSDNCTALANGSQYDADDDGYGNICDGDFNNDGVIGGPDTAAYAACHGETLPTTNGPTVDPACNRMNMNGAQDDIGVINNADFILYRAQAAAGLGPSCVDNPSGCQ